MRSLCLWASLAMTAALNSAGRPQDLGIPAPEAVKRITVPEGFKAHLFAAEPDVRQPNAFCIDDRGRLWVTENFSYTGPGGPWKPSGKDTIVILEDTNGDGKFDTRKVFIDTLSFVSGLEIGFGGVWAGSPPNLLFIPDKDGNDKPDGEPQVILDGWGKQDQHETLNSFIWGPDGWLYGCHGVFTHSRVGKPGTPDADRVGVNAAVWRYHPTKKVFESFAEGTSNPWGLDFDDHGQAFIEACVIPHLWHVIQGARYHRQGGQHFNKHTYEDIKTIADHKHEGLKGRKGGHAHGGARFVLNDVFPPEWRGRFLVGTIHHHGIYTEAFERRGSGFVGKHVDDFLMANDPIYLGFNHDFGPDGSLYVIDWYDPKSCHGQTPTHIETGRIYKITYGAAKKVDVHLSKLSSAELVKLQLHPNDWYVRHARRILQEQGPDPEVHQALASLYASTPEVPRKLRLLWALHATGGLTEATLLSQLKSEHEYIRSWAIQLLQEDKKASAMALAEFARLAKEDPSPAVRLHLASAAIRTAPADRWPIVEALAAHAEDEKDHNLPLVIWYAVEPLVMLDTPRVLRLAATAKIPKVREFITRRVVAGAATPMKPRAEPAKSVPDTDLVLRFKPGETKTAQLQATNQGRAAVRFDGSVEPHVFPHAPELSFKASASFTISAWVYLPNVPQGKWTGVVTKSRDASPWYGIWIDPNSQWVFGGPGNVTGSDAATGWHHVCGVQADGGRRIYINGQEAGSGAAAAGDGAGDLWIGGAKGVKEPFAGSLGEIRIYRRALSPAEVSHLALNP